MTYQGRGATLSRLGRTRSAAGERADLVDERFTQLLGLAGADAVDRVQVLDTRGFQARQLAKCGVVEDDVRRHAAVAGDPQADGAQAVEEVVIHVLPRLGRRARTFGT